MKGLIHYLRPPVLTSLNEEEFQRIAGPMSSIATNFFIWGFIVGGLMTAVGFLVARP